MAVTAYPVILVDSTDGAASDTACSGAGPTTALTGSSATTGASGLVVSLDGTPDLSGVATDGSHVLFYNDTTTGARRFSAINAKDDGADTVTVEQALATSHGATAWAIGGVRATIAGTESALLFNNNTAAGDAMPGWTVEMQSGHTETVSGTIDTYRGGDVTVGPVTLRGAAGAATRPVITGTNASNCIVIRGEGQEFKSFDLVKNSADGGNAIVYGSGVNMSKLYDIDIGDGTHSFATGVSGTNGTAIIGCAIRDTTGDAITIASGNFASVYCYGNIIENAGGKGIYISSAQRVAPVLVGNIIAGCTGVGLDYDNSRTDTIASGLCVFGNVFYNNGGTGLDIQTVTTRTMAAVMVANNLFKDNGAWGIKVNNGLGDVSLGAFFNNGFSGNTSGSLSDSSGTDKESVIAINSVLSADVDNASFGTGGDYTLGSSSNLKAAGFGLGGFTDIGAVQREEPAGGGPGPQIMRPLTGAFPVAS